MLSHHWKMSQWHRQDIELENCINCISIGNGTKLEKAEAEKRLAMLCLCEAAAYCPCNRTGEKLVRMLLDFVETLSSCCSVHVPLMLQKTVTHTIMHDKSESCIAEEVMSEAELDKNLLYRGRFFEKVYRDTASHDSKALYQN